MRGPSLLLASFPIASAFRHHHAPRAPPSAMSSLSLPSPLPSLPVPSLPLSSPPPLSASQSTPSSSPTPSSPPPTTPSSSASSSAPSSSPSSSPQTSTSSTLSATTTPTAVAQQQDSTPTTTFATAAGISDPGPSSSVVVFTFPATITPSSTATKPASPGFFSDTGAVAGTFTAVGLVGIASVIAVALLIIRRSNSRPHEEDMEYLDKSPDLSSDPPMNYTSIDDGFTSDHGHYTASPMALASPPAAYHPGNAYALHPQAFSPDPPGSHRYPAGHTLDYAAQHVYHPDDYDIAYPPSTPHVEPSMPNPHEFSDAELASAPAPPTQAVPPDALRPSVKPTQSVPRQWESTRFSVDSFYTGIATDHRSPTGQAL